MHLTEKQKLMLAIVIFMITGYVLYSTFFKSPATEVSPVTVDGVIVAPVPENQDIIDLATKFDQMSVNIELFSSTLFKNLRDLEVPLSPETSGRPNPFASIGSDNVYVGQPVAPVGTTTKKTP